jgi:hypothetical protein
MYLFVENVNIRPFGREAKFNSTLVQLESSSNAVVKAF